MKRIILASLVTATLGANAAVAEPHRSHHAPQGMRGGPEAMFERFDANGDGVITGEEAKTQRALMFDNLDRNEDGYLDGPEKRLVRKKQHARHKIHRAERRADRQLALDTNKDGKISLAEFEAKPSPLFTNLDKNNDGAISANEHQAAKAKHFARLDVDNDGFITSDDHKAKRQKHKIGKGKGKGKGGRISRAEFIDGETPMFTRFDVNGDGQVTRDEVQSAPRPGRHKQGRP